jgi:hypothetical protein
LESREPEKAMADYRLSIEHLHLAPAAGRLGHEALCARIGCQARLAFMYILRNDPRAAAALDEAEALAKNESTPIDTQALVAQVRGELLRRQGDRGTAAVRAVWQSAAGHQGLQHLGPGLQRCARPSQYAPVRQ